MGKLQKLLSLMNGSEKSSKPQSFLEFLKQWKPLDWAALCLYLAVLVVYGWFALSVHNENKTAVIRTPEGTWMYPLQDKRVLRLKGSLGISEILIRGKAVWFSESPCKEKICIHSGRISQTGQWAACLPNRIMISIEGKQKIQTDN